MIIPKINIEDYNYKLPDYRIARYPVPERDASKLLIYNNGSIGHDSFKNISDHIPPGSLLVFNNTKVIRARLFFRKETGSIIEILCLEPILPFDYQESLGSMKPVTWKCMVGNLKKWKKGTLSLRFRLKERENTLIAHKTGIDVDNQIVKFEWDNPDLSFGKVLESIGIIPLPPYLKREATGDDIKRYQTIYATSEGSVAAPTAGLHFSDQVFRSFAAKEIKTAEITLHVGAGTFQPVRNDDINEHEMHCEHFSINRDTIRMLLASEGMIIPVGTTSVRTLESIYWLGVKIILGVGSEPQEFNISQWYPYENESKVTFREALGALINFMVKKNLMILNGTTRLIIMPGYDFRAIRGMITNFHQPRSTLLLLVSAFTGDDWKLIYNYALGNNFRFLSYGDSSILFKNDINNAKDQF